MNLLPRRMRRLKRLCEVLGRAKALAPQVCRETSVVFFFSLVFLGPSGLSLGGGEVIW